MKIGFTLVAGLVVAGAIGTTAISDAHVDKALLAAANARQAHMQLYNFNAGLLFMMAKGDVEYDADAAQGAASNLAAQSRMNQSRYWPQGSDNAALGDATRALPAIWTSESKAGEYGMALADAATAMDAAAGQGLDALRGAIGAVGKACTSCHEDYRKPFN